MLDLLRRNTPPPASRILRPGVRTLPERVERYPVPGAGSVVVEVKAGDLLRLTDIEGGQACEVLFCGTDGAFDVAALGTKPDGTGEGLKSLLSRGSASVARTLGALRRRGIDLAKVDTAFELFSQIDREVKEQQGGGMGLAIARRYASAHKGRLEFRAREGGGAIVTLVLPLLDKATVAKIDPLMREQ
jgi:hypothetical protein